MWLFLILSFMEVRSSKVKVLIAASSPESHIPLIKVSLLNALICDENIVTSR